MSGLRVATFNVKDFFLPTTEQDRPIVDRKVANLAANLRRANADVVALQEVGQPELLDRLIGGHLGDLGYGAPVLGTADRRGIRCAILSRLPVVWSQVHAPRTLPFPRFVDSDPEPFGDRILLRRGIVHVRVESLGFGEVDVLTAHLKSNLGVPMRHADGGEVIALSPRERAEAALRGLVQRAAEALYVRGLVDEVLRASPDHAICVVGDFNDTAESLPVRILRGIGAAPGEALYAAAERIATERRFSCFHGDAPTLIDHVLVSERLHPTLTDLAIFNEALRSHGPPPVGGPALTDDSDHALVVAAFGIDGVGA